MLPNVDDEHFAGRQRKECTLPLEVLVLSSFATVRALDVHDQDVVRHPRAFVTLNLALKLVFGQPDSLCSLPSLQLGHDAELGAEKVIKESGLAGGLRTKDGDQVVIETGAGDTFEGQVLGEVRAV